MRLALIVLEAVVGLMVTLGCSTTAGDVSKIDTSGRDQACVRQCTATYSDCASGAGRTIGVGNMASVLGACRSGYEACVGTCPK